MDISKGIDKAVDQAACVAKQKIGELVPGGTKKPAGDKGAPAAKGEKGVGDMISGAVGKAVGDAAADNAADQAMSFGKKLFK